MYEYAVIHVGIDPKYFYKLTLYEYRLLYARHLFESAKAWEHSRLITYTLYCANAKKPISIKDFMPLLTDTEEKKREMTIEENIDAQARAIELYNSIRK